MKIEILKKPKQRLDPQIKSKLKTKQQKQMNLLDFMLQSSEYMQDYLVRMTHHSTAIEGNTLTQEQTASILLSGVISGNILEREFYEVKNYKKIMPFILQNIQEKQKLTPKLI